MKTRNRLIDNMEVSVMKGENEYVFFLSKEKGGPIISNDNFRLAESKFKDALKFMDLVVNVINSNDKFYDEWT